MEIKNLELFNKDGKLNSENTKNFCQEFFKWCLSLKDGGRKYFFSLPKLICLNKFDDRIINKIKIRKGIPKNHKYVLYASYSESTNNIFISISEIFNEIKKIKYTDRISEENTFKTLLCANILHELHHSIAYDNNYKHIEDAINLNILPKFIIKYNDQIEELIGTKISSFRYIKNKISIESPEEILEYAIQNHNCYHFKKSSEPVFKLKRIISSSDKRKLNEEDISFIYILLKNAYRKNEIYSAVCIYD